MLRNTNDLIGSSIRATDGEIGAVTTLYFDDERWTLRYVVVDTGTWLLGRQVLLAPVSIRNVNWTDRALEVALTREQVKGSPDVDTHRPVSRQYEVRYAGYYGYPLYWGGPAMAEMGGYPGVLAEQRMASAIAEEEALRPERGEDSHLRSVIVVKGYHLHATDGEIGHVESFLIDDDWVIRYLVVDTSNWWGGRRVLVAPAWIRSVNWNESTVSVDLTRDAIRHSPEYDPAGLVNRPYEEGLHTHYGVAGYWMTDRTGSPAKRTTTDSTTEQFARLDEVSDLEVADDEPDVRAWRVVTSDGKHVGTVEHLIVDRPAMKVRYLEVGLDETAVGLTEHRDVLIPLSDVDLNEQDEEVRVSTASAASIARLPAFTGLPVEVGYDKVFRATTGIPGRTATAREVRLRSQSGGGQWQR